MNLDKRIIAAIIIIAICVVGFSVYFFVLRKSTTKTTNKKTVTKTKKSKTTIEENQEYQKMYQKCLKYFGKSVESIVPYKWFVKAVKLKDYLKEKAGNITTFYINVTSSMRKSSNFSVEMYMDGYAYGPSSVVASNINPMEYTLFYSKVTTIVSGPEGTITKVLYTMVNNSTVIVCGKTIQPNQGPGFCGIERLPNKSTSEKLKLWMLLLYGYLLKNHMITFYNTSSSTSIEIKITRLPNISSNITVVKNLPATIYLNYTKSGIEEIVFIMNGIKMTFKPSNLEPKDILEKIKNTLEEFKSSGAKFEIITNNTTTAH